MEDMEDKWAQWRTSSSMEDGCEVWLGCDNSIEQFSGGGGTNIPALVNFLLGLS